MPLYRDPVASVTFSHLDDLRVDCQTGESLYEIAWRIGKPLSSACGAKATCGLCRVKVTGGEDHLSELTDAEERHLGNVYYLTKLRLGCQARVQTDGDVTVIAAPARVKKKKPR